MSLLIITLDIQHLQALQLLLDYLLFLDRLKIYNVSEINMQTRRSKKEIKTKLLNRNSKL